MVEIEEIGEKESLMIGLWDCWNFSWLGSRGIGCSFLSIKSLKKNCFKFQKPQYSDFIVNVKTHRSENSRVRIPQKINLYGLHLFF